MRLAVVKVDVEAIESGRARTSAETFRPVWMDIGGSCSGKRTANNGGAASAPPRGGGVPVASGDTDSMMGEKSEAAGAKGGSDARQGQAAKGTDEIYLARVNWLQDGSLCAQVQSRSQTELRLLRLDPETGRPTTLVVEKTKVWINLHHLLRSLPSPAPQVSRLMGAFGIMMGFVLRFYRGN